MFIDFDKVFFNRNNSDQVPKEVIDALTNQLPEGFEYGLLENGAVALTPLTEDIQIGGLTFNLNDPVFGEFVPKNTTEALEYLYRSQNKLTLNLADNEGVYINNQFFKMSDVIKFPLGEVTTGNHLITITPHPFKPPFELKLETKDITELFMVQRVPYADMNKLKFESINDGSFKISYIIDVKKERFNFNFKIQFDNVVSSLDMLHALKLYYGCLTGDFKLHGHKMKYNDYNEEEAKSVLQNIELWEKILLIEEKLDVKFTPDIGLDKDDEIITEKIYRSLIENKPFKEFVTINDFTMSKAEDSSTMNNILGKEEISFSLTNEVHISLLGVNINLYMLTYLFNLIVTKYEEVDDKIKLLTEAPKGKKTYQVVKFYVKESDIMIFEKEMDKFMNADEISI